MSLESEVLARLDGNIPLKAILIGGIYSFLAIGEEGISIATTPAAFDDDGVLLPCVLVQERAEIPSGGIKDEQERIASAQQMLAVWVYRSIVAKDHVYTLLQNFKPLRGYRLEWAGNYPSPRVQQGPLLYSSVIRMDFRSVYLQRPLS